jgi:hypothetical protein
VQTFGLSQTPLDQVNVCFRRGDAPRGFLLEGVQDIDRLRITDRINGTPCVAPMVGDDLKHRTATESFQRLGGWISFALLGRIESNANIASNLARKPAYVFAA